MKIMTVLGTRPEIIRLSRVIDKLDRLCHHVLVHTGQNFDRNLSDIFFDELKIRQPDHYLAIKGESFGQQVGQMLEKMDEVLAKEKPDRLLVLGDTNSGLSTVLAKRRGVPVFHMEAGNRCYDDRVPEEVNRRIIDHSSDVLMPYTERSRQNLLKEGIEGQRIFVTGNPILEVIKNYENDIDKSNIHKDLGLAKNKYFLVTLHRAENVDNELRLRSILKGLDKAQREFGYTLILSFHPHARQKIVQYAIKISNPDMQLIDPPGFFSFISLEKKAFCVLSDSGTVQEECCIFRIPNVTIRDVTERPETIESGSNILSGHDPDSIINCIKILQLNSPNWKPPREYLVSDVSTTVSKIAMGYINVRFKDG